MQCLNFAKEILYLTFEQIQTAMAVLIWLEDRLFLKRKLIWDFNCYYQQIGYVHSKDFTMKSFGEVHWMMQIYPMCGFWSITIQA